MPDSLSVIRKKCINFVAEPMNIDKEHIELRGLNIGYIGKIGVKTVATNINASIRRGELTCLLGANGVGKSTLLRTLSAFQPKLAGEIFIDGREIGQYTAQELSRLIGVVLTEKPELRNMSVEELVCVGRSPYTGFWGNYSDEDRRIASEAMLQVGIGELRDRLVETLSDGERQKVMIAKALAQQTPVIYLDEPTAFLDFPSKVEVMLLLRRICQESRKIIFLSTHDLELALQIADCIWLMDKRTSSDKTVEEQIYIGTPQELSAKGVLGRFVERRGITFDSQTMTIRIDKTA